MTEHSPPESSRNAHPPASSDSPRNAVDLLAGDEPLTAEFADDDPHAADGRRDTDPAQGQHQRFRLPRRRGLPLILLALSVLSTFLVGVCNWNPAGLMYQCLVIPYGSIDLMPLRRAIITNWQDGLIYSACVLGILLTHEMGHFLMTVRYHVPASFPFCIPFPISPIGTMGAVIAMDGRRTDRKQMFDIGLAGPLAGLVVAIPIMWIGIERLDLRDPPPSAFALESPLAVRWALDKTQPPGYEPGSRMIGNNSLNPYFMAGWVGLLITGLNMMPVSQLDGGHVAYALLGKWAHWLARGVMVLAIAFTVYASVPLWVLMIGLVLLLGVDHPPTRDDNAPLGWFRIGLGVASLAIPVLCFSPFALMTGM
jgi:Zn-dependent protease